MERLPTLDILAAATDTVIRSGMHFRTPMLKEAQDMFGLKDDIHLYLKLENMQNTGSFKIRGIANQLANLPPSIGTKENKLISMSAGNYGKSFAYATEKHGLAGVILMPVSAPDNRATVIESYGVKVERYPTAQLQSKIDEYVKSEGMFFCHSFDDPYLIHGHSSLGFEILEDCPDPDVVVICCGGGGLLAGTAAAIRLSGNTKCRIYGVEPEGAASMYKSFKEGKAVGLPTASSVASGLAPPYAGKLAYHYCKNYIDDIILVSDEEILRTMLRLYSRGLVVEASGCAAFTALFERKIPNGFGKKIVIVVTGGNVTAEEMYQHKINIKG
ncbi:L-threonine dehydratase catabolic TdcB-like isoform X2 [Tubulanus polymorphus]